MRWGLVVALAAAVIVGHHALYWIAAAADVAPYVADAATAGVERALLYIVIAALLLAAPPSIALRAAAGHRAVWPHRVDHGCRLRVRGCLVADRSLRWQDFKLRPFGGDAALLRDGLPWSIRHNCVTLR